MKKMDTSKKSDSELAHYFSPQRLKLIVSDPRTLTVGLRIRRERYMRRLTLEQMALMLEISASYLGALERGNRPLSRKMIEVLHVRLDLSYDYILEGRELTPAGLSHFVKETPSYMEVYDLESLVAACNKEEREGCFNLIYAYLKHKRKNSDAFCWKLPE